MRRRTVVERDRKTAARVVVFTRAKGRCEWCGESVDFRDFSIHHRLPGQMGGDRRDYWHPSRLLLLCGSGTTGCHGYFESQRALAYMTGVLVRRPGLGVDVGKFCAAQRVLIRNERWRLLTADGSYREAA